MASRLTVVVSQASSGLSASGDLEESLVAELMMTNGIDATMVGPLERIQPADTDCLCLSSFNHSFVVVSALTTAEVQRNWDRLGLSGTVLLAGESANASENSSVAANRGRRIFHLLLEPDSQISGLMQRVQQIYRDRNVKTVTIGGLSAGPSATQDSDPAVATNAATKPLSEKSGVSARPAGGTSDPALPEHLASAKAESSKAKHLLSDARPPAYEDVEDEQWQHLDQLVDDLDELDL